MARANRRGGFGVLRGATNNRSVIADNAPNNPNNTDRWVDKTTGQEYYWDKPSSTWIPLLSTGGAGVTGALVYHNDTNTTAVSTNVEVGTVDVTLNYDGAIIVTGTFVGTASTAMTLTALVKLDTVTQHTMVQYISGAVDDTVSFSIVLDGLDAGDYTVSVDMAASTGTFTLDANEQHFHTFTFYDVVAPIPPSAFGTYELLADTTISSATTQVDFTGLSLTADDEILLVSDIVNASGSTSNYSLYVNADTTATNYYSQKLYGNGSSLTGSRANDGVYATLETSDNLWGMTNIKINDAGYFICQSFDHRRYSASDASLNDMFSMKTATIASITQLNIVASITNAIGIGSRFWLYKVGDNT